MMAMSTLLYAATLSVFIARLSSEQSFITEPTPTYQALYTDSS